MIIVVQYGKNFIRNFLINIYKSQTKLGEAVKLKFNLAQHSRDSELVMSFEKYLGCGSINKHSGNATVFIVSRLSDITEKIIPFFDKYQLIGVKSQDYQDFKKVAENKSTPGVEPPRSSLTHSSTWASET